MHTKESITVRANKKGRVEFKIKTYSPMYIKVKWRNGAGGVVSQKVGRNETVTFASDLPTETDQEILVYGAKHLKEIGDISNMKPSSLSLGDATRLTKLICTNSPNLQALGLGGTTKAVNSLKNLQLIDLTGCSKLGTVASSGGIDVSNCDNLKTLKLHGTNLQSVTVNIEGGNLEEMYLPNSITSLYLANQYNLRKVEFPGYNWADRLQKRSCYDNGSKITNLTINNCPNLTNLGLAQTFATNAIRNYRGVVIDNQDKNFDISKEEYNQIFKLSCFGRLEKVNITNSLLNYTYYNINTSPHLKTISLNDMPNLKGIMFTGNREYGYPGGSAGTNLEKEAMFEGITIEKCKNFDTIIIQYGEREETALKFKENFEWDLSNLPLKRFICNMALQNLKKIILPDTIEEFSHSNTRLNHWSDLAPDGSREGYYKEMSPLETIVIKGHYKEGFTGIDLADIHLKNVSLGGLTQKVAIIQNVDCEAIEISPQMVSEHIAKSNTTQPLDNIKINLNNYKGNSLARLCYEADLTKYTITLDKKLTTEGMDYSYMFQRATHVEWENIKDFINNLPPGKLYYTFQSCDVDKLKVGHMMGSTTTALLWCFAGMPNVTEINLTGANCVNLNNMEHAFQSNQNLTTINLEGFDFSKVKQCPGCFSNNPKLKQIIGAENVIQPQCTNIERLFNNTPKLKFDFTDGKPKWRFSQNGFNGSHRWLSGCGTDVQLADNEEYILDLRDCGIYKGDPGGMIDMNGFSKIYTSVFDATATSPYQMGIFENSKNLKEIHIAEGSQFVNDFSNLAASCPKLTTVNMNNVDISRITKAINIFQNSTNLTDLTFGKGARVSLDFSTNEKLTKPSLMSILENVGTANAGATLTFSQDSWNLLSDEDRNIAARKGWTIARG